MAKKSPNSKVEFWSDFDLNLSFGEIIPFFPKIPRLQSSIWVCSQAPDITTTKPNLKTWSNTAFDFSNKFTLEQRSDKWPNMFGNQIECYCTLQMYTHVHVFYLLIYKLGHVSLITLVTQFWDCSRLIVWTWSIAKRFENFHQRFLSISKPQNPSQEKNFSFLRR